MPFVGKWVAQIQAVSQFDNITTELNEFSEGIDAIYGSKNGGSSMVQSLRFSADDFTEEDIERWLAENDFEAISIEAPIKEGSIGSIDKVVAISATGPWTPIGGPTSSEGVISQRFKKELISVGDYEYQDGGGFGVTRQDLHNWVTVSKQMHKNGVRIPVSAGPIPHEDVGNPDNAIGTMEDEFVEGDGLFVILEIVGEENIEEAMANDVSIFSPIEFTDGKGRVYTQPITHVAITPNPLVPDLEGWEIAASLKTSNVGKEKGMWKKIAKALGLETDKITDENATEKILAGIKEMKQAHKDEVKEAKKAAKKASIEDEGVKELVDAEVAKQTKDIKATLSGTKKDADPMLVGLTVDNRKMKLDSLFGACRITPDVRKDIEARFGTKDVIAASLKAGENGDIFDFMCGILSKNDPVTLVEKTGAQVKKAALKKPEAIKDEDSPLLQDVARREKLASK